MCFEWRRERILRLFDRCSLILWLSGFDVSRQDVQTRRIFGAVCNSHARDEMDDGDARP
jgi:hypothetical protein